MFNSFVSLFLFVIKDRISALWAVTIIIIELLHVPRKRCHQTDVTKQLSPFHMLISHSCDIILVPTDTHTRTHAHTHTHTHTLPWLVTGILQWILGNRSIQWMSFLTRQTLEKSVDYEDARTTLKEAKLLAPAYFIVGGNKTGQVSGDTVSTWVVTLHLILCRRVLSCLANTLSRINGQIWCAFLLGYYR